MRGLLLLCSLLTCCRPIWRQVESMYSSNCEAAQSSACCWGKRLGSRTGEVKSDSSCSRVHEQHPSRRRSACLICTTAIGSDDVSRRRRLCFLSPTARAWALLSPLPSALRALLRLEIDCSWWRSRLESSRQRGHGPPTRQRESTKLRRIAPPRCIEATRNIAVPRVYSWRYRCWYY